MLLYYTVGFSWLLVGWFGWALGAAASRGDRVTLPPR